MTFITKTKERNLSTTLPVLQIYARSRSSTNCIYSARLQNKHFSRQGMCRGHVSMHQGWPGAVPAGAPGAQRPPAHATHKGFRNPLPPCALTSQFTAQYPTQAQRTRQLPSNVPTWSVWSATVCAHVRVVRSHSFTLPSLLPVANAVPSGWHDTDSTHDSWPARDSCLCSCVLLNVRSNCDCG